ncbi:RCC1 and BTB domain-containing protein 1-like [Ostrea edulis]|uniref:RCC1 and BTB domain-containing protein 1-like n=1 Tax=Ostrea edulis TaxID=37623 RepID=UPI0024AF8BF5|nr:RCC1 and BTB domain-containing protein 1-like [Ostrea edulis]
MAFPFSADYINTFNINNEDVENVENVSEKDYFPFDPDVADVALIVEGKKLHVSKMVLMDASPVFRKMFTGDFKEKTATELELPGKEYSTFVLFLRCIFPREYIKMTESRVRDLLPLAHEYDVKCVLRECETFLLTELEFKKIKAPFHYVSADNDVEYCMKCLYYGSEYGLNEIYDNAFQTVIPYKLARYADNEFYELLPEKNKRELLQSRLSSIEKAGENLTNGSTLSLTQSVFGFGSVQPTRSNSSIKYDQSIAVFKCPSDLFL